MSRIFDEVPDLTDTKEFAQAKKEVRQFVKDHPDGVKIVDLNREFPAHVRIIFSILQALQVDGYVHFEDWRPAPIKIYPGDRTLKQRHLSRREMSTQIYNYRNNKKRKVKEDV